MARTVLYIPLFAAKPGITQHNSLAWDYNESIDVALDMVWAWRQTKG